MNDTQKRYIATHKKEISENKARYYQRHKEKLKEIRKVYHKEHPEIDVKYKKSPKGRLMIYQRGARKRNLEFTLELHYFENNWNQICVYCGDTVDGIGIDRIDSSRGYTYDNVANCCTKCNVMKLNYGEEEFIEHCRKVSLNN